MSRPITRNFMIGFNIGGNVPCQSSGCDDARLVLFPTGKADKKVMGDTYVWINAFVVRLEGFFYFYIPRTKSNSLDR